MTANPSVTACVIIIGNEVLSGRTADANLAYLGRELNALGIRLMEARVIRDDEDAIVDTVNACRAAFDYVFTTGGIGPTHDDITAASVAKAFGVRLVRNAEAMARLARQYTPEDFLRAIIKSDTSLGMPRYMEDLPGHVTDIQVLAPFKHAIHSKCERARFDSVLGLAHALKHVHSPDSPFVTLLQGFGLAFVNP